MICKNCGLEYPDDMEACPGCGAPNDNVEAQPMSEGERDSFEGITIDTGTDDGPDGTSYRVYDRDDVNRQQKKEKRKEKISFWWDLLRNNLKTAAVIALLVVLFIALLPTLLGFLAIGVGVYLAVTLLNAFLSGR